REKKDVELELGAVVGVGAFLEDGLLELAGGEAARLPEDGLHLLHHPALLLAIEAVDPALHRHAEAPPLGPVNDGLLGAVTGPRPRPVALPAVLAVGLNAGARPHRRRRLRPQDRRGVEGYEIADRELDLARGRVESDHVKLRSGTSLRPSLFFFQALLS